MVGLMLRVATWICWTSYINGYVGLLILHLLLLLNTVGLPLRVGGLLPILIVRKIFLSPFLDVLRMSRPTVSFFAKRLWNSLRAECFPVTYDLNGLKSRVNKHDLPCFFLIRFPIHFSSLNSSFSCNCMPCSGFLVLYEVNPN